MVYKLNPLEVVLDFEDRVYELGDAINLQVALTVNGDANVRGGRIDLVCEEHYSQTGTTFVPDTYASSTGAGQGTAGSTRNVGKERKEILLQHFGSVRRLRNAWVEKIAGVQGVGPELAHMIRDEIDARVSSKAAPARD